MVYSSTKAAQLKYALVNVLDQDPEQWQYVIDGVLFGHHLPRVHRQIIHHFI